MTSGRQIDMVGTMKRRRTGGFSLIEAVMVIALTGIVAGMVAVFIRKPVEGFFDTARRAALVDTADTVLRRVSRDLRNALPNSVRISGGTALEFLHVRSGGRYREQGPGDILDFTAADSSFDVLSPGVSVQSGDSIVVYNLGVTGASAYEGVTTSRRIAAAPFGPSLSNLAITSATRFPFTSPAKRFQVVDTPVSYICSAGQILRYSGYVISASQPVPPAATGMPIADKVSACNFAYTTGPSERAALITLSLSLTDGGETASLIYQVHVNNAP